MARQKRLASLMQGVMANNSFQRTVKKLRFLPSAEFQR
jgi:hypothetical protein